MLDINDDKLKRGYVRLFRAIDSWEWYTDVNTYKLFTHCLIKANHTDKIWRGVTIQRGSFITSYQNLSIETGLTIKQVRTALNKLKTTGELAHKGQASYSIITVKNYDTYQPEGKQEDTQRADEGQAEGKQRATTNNVNNDNNINNNKEENLKKIKDPYLSNEVVTFLETFKKTCKKPTALSPDERIRLVNILNDLILNQGRTFEDITETVCKNFNNLNFDKNKINVGINWLLKDSNFYSVLNGQNTKIEIDSKKDLKENWTTKDLLTVETEIKQEDAWKL